MLEKYPENKYYSSFEGGILTQDGFLSGKPGRVVYWGTSGQRITEKYYFDCFSMKELLDSGILLHGADIRDKMKMPSYNDLYSAVKGHYDIIRKFAVTTDRSLYSYGWLLDISRCIYTLQTGGIIAKTDAGEWALSQNLCPDADALEKALNVRMNTEKHLNIPGTFDYAEALGNAVQRYADVLEKELWLNSQRLSKD